MTDPTAELNPADAELAALVHEVEGHIAAEGWDAPAHLFALVSAEELLSAEPELAEQIGLGKPGAPTLVPIESDEVPAEIPLEELLLGITWPPSVAGCAASVERLVLPPEAEQEIPDDPEEADAYAAAHPDRQEVRIVAAVTRAGATACAMRLRSHDDDSEVMVGPDLVPALLDMLRETLDPNDVDLGGDQ